MLCTVNETDYDIYILLIIQLLSRWNWGGGGGRKCTTPARHGLTAGVFEGLYLEHMVGNCC